MDICGLLAQNPPFLLWYYPSNFGAGGPLTIPSPCDLGKADSARSVRSPHNSGMTPTGPIESSPALLPKRVGSKCFLFVGTGSFREPSFWDHLCCHVRRACPKNDDNTEENRAEKPRDRTSPAWHKLNTDCYWTIYSWRFLVMRAQ